MKSLFLVFVVLFTFKSYAQGSLEGDRLALVALYNSTNGAGWINKTGWVVPGTTGDNPCGWFGVTCSGGRVTGLNLSVNRLEGVLPIEIGNLTELKSLNLNGTGLNDEDFQHNGFIYGDLVSQLGLLTKLEYLDLGGNSFSGSIPSSLGNLTNLTYLDLNYIPYDAGFDPWGGLSGSIPNTFGNLLALKHLDISSQNLTGNLPAELGNLSNLEFINLGSNNFSGQIPSSYGNLHNLTYLNLSYYGYLRDNQFGNLIGPLPDFSGLPANAKIYIQYQSFNFDGIRQNLSRIGGYSPQAELEIIQSTLPPTGFWAYSGEVETSIYKWYFDGELVSTIIGDGFYAADMQGLYKLEVVNPKIPGLVLTGSKLFSHLPVTLVSFRGAKQGRENLLTWQTTSETNNAGFEIQKSANAINFDKIGFVDGNGDSKQNESYSFTDDDPLPTTYYRLKQIDFDGKFEYSRIISVKRDLSEISIYPNPAAEYLSVRELEKEEIMIIRNLDGKIMFNESILPKQSISISHLSNGLYMVTVGDETRKVVIQK